jgi:hypothetical protein
MIRKFLVFIVACSLLNVSCKAESQRKKEMKDNIFSELEVVAKGIDEKIEGAIKATYSAATRAEEIFKTQKISSAPKVDRNIYYRDHLGILSDHGHKMATNVYADRTTQLDDYTNWFIKATEKMTPVWEENFKKYPYLGWQYLLETKYTSLRIFPWLDTTTSFGPGVKFRKLGFYQCVTPENNPGHELKSSRMGVDILGLGLLFSPSIPIYVDDTLVAVSALDFLVTKTFESYLYRNYSGKNSYIMLVDGRTFQIILRNNQNKDERGWDLLFNYTYIDKFAEEHPELKKALDQFSSDKKGVIEVSMPNKKLIYFQKLNNIDWIVAIVTEA